MQIKSEKRTRLSLFQFVSVVQVLMLCKILTWRNEIFIIEIQLTPFLDGAQQWVAPGLMSSETAAGRWGEYFYCCQLEMDPKTDRERGHQLPFITIHMGSKLSLIQPLTLVIINKFKWNVVSTVDYVFYLAYLLYNQWSIPILISNQLSHHAWRGFQTKHRHRRNVTSHHFFDYYNFHHQITFITRKLSALDNFHHLINFITW